MCQELNINKYSFHKKLGLRLATNYSWCFLKKPLHISIADTKIFICGIQAKMIGAGFIPFLDWNTIKMPLTAHDICANSAHDPVCEQLMDAHDIYANSALGYANSAHA